MQTINGRSRNQDGRIRRKNGHTKVENIECDYDIDFGVRGDMRLDTLLEREGVDSLTQLLNKFNPQ